MRLLSAAPCAVVQILQLLLVLSTALLSAGRAGLPLPVGARVESSLQSGVHEAGFGVPKLSPSARFASCAKRQNVDLIAS